MSNLVMLYKDKMSDLCNSFIIPNGVTWVLLYKLISISQYTFVHERAFSNENPQYIDMGKSI